MAGHTPGTPLVEQKQKLVDGDFRVFIRTALNSHLEFIARAGQQMDPSSPDALYASAGAVKLLGERYERFTMLESATRGEPLLKAVKAGQ